MMLDFCLKDDHIMCGSVRCYNSAIKQSLAFQERFTLFFCSCELQAGHDKLLSLRFWSRLGHVVVTHMTWGRLLKHRSLK